MFDEEAFDLDAFSDEAFTFDADATPDVEPVGGHYYPTKPPKKPKDYRSEQDERQLQEARELHEAVQRAALVEKAQDVLTEAQEKAAIEPPSTAPRTKRLRVFRRQVASLEKDFAEIKSDLAQPNEQALHAVQERLDALIAKAADELVSQVAEALIELIQEIIEDDDAA